MKVHVELELSPEEARRLFGLPDVAPVNEAIVERLSAQVEKGLDGTMLRDLVRSMVTGGMQSVEGYQRFLGEMFRAVRGAASGAEGGGGPGASPGEGAASTERGDADAARQAEKARPAAEAGDAGDQGANTGSPNT